MKFIRFCLLLGCLILTSSIYATPTGWVTLQPGIDYARIRDFPDFPGGSIHAFRIDPQLYRLQIGLSDKENQTVASVPELLEKHRAIIASNGGFFSPELKPLGLRISEGKELSPIRATAWWGVFFMQNARPRIVAQKEYVTDPGIEFAIQSGPRLLVDGAIPRLTSGMDYRTALCITATGRIVLLTTENLMLSTVNLAEMIRRPTAEGGLDCVDALNLDGGHSSQMYARFKSFGLQVTSYTPVADALLVIPKEMKSRE